MASFIKYQGTARVVKKPTDTSIESELLPKVGVRVMQSSGKDAQFNLNTYERFSQFRAGVSENLHAGHSVFAFHAFVTPVLY